MIWIFYALLFIVGAVFGSFLNAWVWRSAQWIPIWRGRSRCTVCAVEICSRDLVPVISFFLLSGKCRNCKNRIPAHYPFVELVCAVLFVWLARIHGLSAFSMNAEYVRDAAVIFLLVFIFLYDFFYMEILDRSTTVPAIILFVLAWQFGWADWQNMLIAAAVGAGFFLIQYLVSAGKWIGGGDIRMGLFMGVVLSWPGIIVGLFLAYIIGAIASIGLILLKKKNRRSEIPFGMYLSLGTFIALFWGEKIINWYLGFL